MHSLTKFWIIFSLLLIVFPHAADARTSIDEKPHQDHMFIEQEKSWMTKLIENGMKNSNMKEGSILGDFINNLTLTTQARPPQTMFLTFQVSVEELFGHNIWDITPRGEISDKVVIYLHGGSYKYNFLPPHWNFISVIADELRVRVIAPDYPLAPAYTAPDVFAFLLNIYSELIKKTDPKDITIMGDSAGGGMTLALAQFIRETGFPQPEQLILLSPCIDVTMSNPGIIKLDLVDPMLNIDSIKAAGKAYAGQLSTKHYLVSPIYGKITGLAPISLYVGTHDLLAADCRKLYKMAKKKNIAFDFYEYEGLFHVGMLFPTPEAEDIRETIIENVKEGSQP
ncbi:MAG: alpha/beta hydrolase fold domain-containing protein [Candidatus Marinimicrobia bacterium]|nr:alpha/beta hydrolase fold domain-containing protein [Candidatus Neomarinimicrobiota bacterium]